MNASTSPPVKCRNSTQAWQWYITYRCPIQAFKVQRDEIPLHLHVYYITFSDTRFADVCKETESCLVLSTVCSLKDNRWPASQRWVPRISHQNWDTRWAHIKWLTPAISGITIPTSLRESFLHDLHKKHADITKCELIHLLAWHWQRYSRFYKAMLYMHHIATYSTIRASYKPRSPQGLWQKIGADCMDYDGKRYLLTVYYVPHTPSFFTCALTDLLSFIGIPLEGFTNNRQPFNSKECYNFIENMVSNKLLQACTTLRPMASLKGMYAPWKVPLARLKLSGCLCHKHLWNYDKHQLALTY